MLPIEVTGFHVILKYKTLEINKSISYANIESGRMSFNSILNVTVSAGNITLNYGLALPPIAQHTR